MHQKFVDFLNKTSANQTNSIESYRLEDGTKVWLKKAVPRHAKWLYALIQWGAKFFHLHLLLPVPNYGGMQSIECEYRRLIELGEKKISVPQVLAKSNNGLLIKDIASGDEDLKQVDQILSEELNFERKKYLFSIVVQAIKDIHLQGEYLSEAFARNILIDHELRISFVDFETDPKTVFNMIDCQTRDWLCFLFSTVFYFSDEELIEIRRIILDNVRPESIIQLNHLGRRFAWLRRIKIQRVGRDGKRLNIFIMFLKNLISR